jgi:hypothetical protein
MAQTPGELELLAVDVTPLTTVLAWSKNAGLTMLSLSVCIRGIFFRLLVVSITTSQFVILPALSVLTKTAFERLRSNEFNVCTPSLMISWAIAG